MRTGTALMALAVAALVTGCIPSLHPLYTDQDLVFEPRLVGTWVGEDEDDTWVFEKSGEKQYELTFTEDGVPAKFEVHLVNLGGSLFMDFYPQELDIEADTDNEFYWLHWIPAHTFARVSIEEDVLRMEMLDADWVDTSLAEGEVKIKHERVNDNIVLTASTKKLQPFMLECTEDEDAFADPTEMKRQKPKGGSEPPTG